MIEIRIDGEALDLSEGTKVRIRRRSQLFERDFVVNDFSFPILLPRTPRNVRLLQHQDRMASTITSVQIECLVVLDGSPWRTAFINFRGITNGLMDVDLSIPSDTIISDLEGLYLQDFDYDGPYSFEHTPDTDIAVFNAFFTDRIGYEEDTPFIFAPIKNNTKFGSRTETYFNVEVGVAPNTDTSPPHDYINYYDPGLSEEFFYYTADPTLDYWFQDFTPLPYLCFVFEHIFGAQQPSTFGDVMNDEEVRTMVITTNMYMMLLVVTSGGVFAFTENDDYNSIDLGRALPYMTCLELLVACMRRFNAVPVFGSDSMSLRSANDILDDLRLWDISDRVVPSDDFETQRPVYFEIVAEDEPLDTQREDVPDYDRDRLIDTVTTEADLAGLGPVVGDFAVVRTSNSLWQYAETTSGPEWKWFADYLYPYIEDGPDRTVLSVGVALTSMYIGEDVLRPGRDWLVPEMSMRLSDPFGDMHSLGRSDATKLRLLFYRGENVDNNSDLYPLLSTEVYDFDGSSTARAQTAERIEGEFGIVDVWYSRWLEVLRNGRTVKRYVRMALHEFTQLDMNRKVAIDGHHYLVRSADIEVGTNGIGLALLELFSITP